MNSVMLVAMMEMPFQDSFTDWMSCLGVCHGVDGIIWIIFISFDRPCLFQQTHYIECCYSMDMKHEEWWLNRHNDPLVAKNLDQLSNAYLWCVIIIYKASNVAMYVKL